MSGIERYSRKQRELSERIKAESLQDRRAAERLASQTHARRPKGSSRRWTGTPGFTTIARIRMNYVCETPVILEQRAFDLGREIQSRLSQTGQ